MSQFSKEQPKMAAKITDLIEEGLTAEQIIASFSDESKKSEKSSEMFSNEVQIISQALAYRKGCAHDLYCITKLLNNSYAPEIFGNEAFRDGDAITLESINATFIDTSYQWLIVEAPNGKDLEEDGVILGACCFSTSGISKRNGIIEGNLGSVRYFGVLPNYHGYCIGYRLLRKMESIMFERGCCRIMVCLPSTRLSLIDWIKRKGYKIANAIDYPFAGIGHIKKLLSNEQTEIDVKLIQFTKVKCIVNLKGNQADSKN